MTIYAGWSRVDITPQKPTPLAGMGKDYERQKNWIWPTKQEDRLKATMVVLSDAAENGNTVVFCFMDTLFIYELFSVPAGQAVAKALGICPENVFFCGSHTHCGVSMAEPDPSVMEYLQWLYEILPQAALEAMQDLAPASVQAGSMETVGMNAQRRYILKDGSHRGSVFDKTFTSEDIAGYETEPDPTLRALRLCRENKPDIMLANWQMHPGYASKVLGAVSADVIGTIRECFAQSEPDCHFAFVQGSAGNMGRLPRWEQDPGYEKSRSLDREGFAKEFVSLLQNIPMEQMQTGKISVCHDVLTVKRRFQTKVIEEDVHLPLNTVRFGDVAFATAPAEAFSDTGLQVRRESAYKMTFFCGCCNGSYGYLPLMECFQADPECISFEVRASRCQPGTAEMLAQKLIAMLK